VPADSAIQVVVLAVYVARDSSTERDESCAGCDRREQPFRDEESEKLVDGDARLGTHSSSGDVEIQNTVQAGAVDYLAAGALRRVAIGASETSSDHWKRVTCKAHEIFKFR